MAHDFSEYPKKLRHHEHAPAQFAPTEGKGIFAETKLISAERFPDVTVHTLEDEKKYASRGYRPQNMANSAEYEAAMLEQSDVEGYQFQEFPKWKYHPVYPAKVIHSAEEEAELGEGWEDRPVEATEADLVKYMPSEVEKAPMQQSEQDNSEADKLAAERAAFEAEKAAHAKEMAEYEAYKASLLKDEKNALSPKEPFSEPLAKDIIPQTGVARHGAPKKK